MIFKNINTVFSLCVCVFLGVFFYLFFRVSAVFSMRYNVLFRFFSFWIVLNVLVQQVNLTEVEVSVETEQ